FSFFPHHPPTPDIHSFPTRRSSDLTGRHQFDERHKILHPKARPPSADADVGISGNAIRPIDGHRAQAAGGVLEGDSILSPKLLRSEEHTSELQSRSDLVCRLLLEKK